MIQLVGKVTAKGNLDLNGKPKLTINQKSGRISLSKKVVDSLNFNTETQSIGFGYDPEKTLGASAFLYVIDNVEEGVKAGKSGSLTSKYHCGELNKMFNAEIGEFNRYELDVASEAKDFNGTNLYALTFSTTLADITRTKKEASVEPVAPQTETPVVQVAEVEVPTVQDNVQNAVQESAPWSSQDMMNDAIAEVESNEEPQEESNEPQAFTFGAEG